LTRYLNSPRYGRCIVTALAIIIAAQLGCGHKPLDRQTAMKVIGSRIIDTIEGSFSASPEYRGNAIPQYQQLLNAGVITCTGSAIMGTVCRPGPAGSGLREGTGEIAFVAGQLVVGSVTAVSETSPTSAIADIQLVFQPTPLYSKYQAQLNLMDDGSSFQIPLQQRIQGRMARAMFQRFDDGWHLQGLQK
jgi:hypothetical protein